METTISGLGLVGDYGIYIYLYILGLANATGLS